MPEISGSLGTVPLPLPERLEASALAPARQSILGWLRRTPFAITALIGIASAVLAWLRIPPVARDTLWAEDGRNFLQDAMNRGPINSLFIPYAGYLHTVPRIIAGIITKVVPIAGYAEAVTIGACLVAGGVAAVVFVCTRDIVKWLPARAFIAMLTVLAPLAPREVLGNLANLHSLMLWMLLWMLLYRPKTSRGSWALGAIALLGALTEIQAIVLLPLLFLSLRDRRRWPLRAGMLLGLAAQLLVTLLWPRPFSGQTAVGFPSLVFGYLINSVVPLWVHQSAIGPVVAGGGLLVCLLLLVPFAVAGTYVMVRGSRAQRVTALSLAVLSVVVYVGSVVRNPSPAYDYAASTPTQLLTVWLTRYGLVPSMMLAALVPLALAVWMQRNRTRGVNVVAAVVLVAFAASMLVQFSPEFTRRSFGPEWRPQVVAAVDTCRALPPKSVVDIKETIGWAVVVPCAAIETGR